jgi:hypothetical protein
MFKLSGEYSDYLNFAHVKDVEEVSKNVFGLEWQELPGLILYTTDYRIVPYPDD